MKFVRLILAVGAAYVMVLAAGYFFGAFTPCPWMWNGEGFRDN